MPKSRTNVVLTLGMCSLLALQGCAALFNGDRAQVNVNSHPTGARVLVDGLEQGRTPITLKLDEKRDHTITLQKGGRQTTINVSKKLGAGWVVLDVLGGLIPVVVDAATGSWYDLEPHTINAQL